LKHPEYLAEELAKSLGYIPCQSASGKRGSSLVPSSIEDKKGSDVAVKSTQELNGLLERVARSILEAYTHDTRGNEPHDIVFDRTLPLDTALSACISQAVRVMLKMASKDRVGVSFSVIDSIHHSTTWPTQAISVLIWQVYDLCAAHSYALYTLFVKFYS
jgi:hypothetical protein